MQKPGASHVAGYEAWNKYFNRQVKKGEKGIQIVGYAPKDVVVEQDVKDKNGDIVIGADGKPEKRREKRKIPCYVPTYVYDVSQTAGDPLPKLTKELEGDVVSYYTLMAALREATPYAITFEDMKDQDIKGYCNNEKRKIAIKDGMSHAHTVKTAIHEIVHAEQYESKRSGPGKTPMDIRGAEVEAESTAFVVCSHYGVDTSEYSYPYIATWGSGREAKELFGVLGRIQEGASSLIKRIDMRFMEKQKEFAQTMENLAPAGEGKLSERIESFLQNNDAYSYSASQPGWENRGQAIGTIEKRLEAGDTEWISGAIANTLQGSPGDVRQGMALLMEVEGLKSMDRGGVGKATQVAENGAMEKNLTEEILDSVRHDNDIDADREQTREQLGFKDDRKQPAPKDKTIASRAADAKEKAGQRNAAAKAAPGKKERVAQDVLQQ